MTKETKQKKTNNTHVFKNKKTCINKKNTKTTKKQTKNNKTHKKKQKHN